MPSSIDRFKASIAEIRDLKATIDQLNNITTSALNVEDFYRGQVVLLISSLDHFIHEFVLEEMISIYDGNRNPTPAFLRFQIPVSSTLNNKPSSSFFASHIREKHSWLSFQDPNKIADAIRLISDKKIWEEVAPKFGISAGDLKSKLKLVVDRRNKIAHESDLDPSYPGRKWPISSTDVLSIINFIDDLGNEIYDKMK